MSEAAPSPFADRRLAMLQRLAELGMILAERLATAAEPYRRDRPAVRPRRQGGAPDPGAGGAAGRGEIKPGPPGCGGWVHRCPSVGKSARSVRNNTQGGLESGRSAGRMSNCWSSSLIARDPRESLADELQADAYDLIEELEEAGVFASKTPLSQIVARPDPRPEPRSRLAPVSPKPIGTSHRTPHPRRAQGGAGSLDGWKSAAWGSGRPAGGRMRSPPDE